MKKYIVFYNFGSVLMGLYDSEKEAKKAKELFEEDDKRNGVYDPGMYEIKEKEFEK